MTDNLEQSRKRVSSTPANVPHGRNVGLRVAYLINQYPKVSHSFIRREVLEAESQGIEVMRMAIRGWDAPLADPLDYAERSRTTYIQQRGLLPLTAAVFSALRQPRAFLRALGAAFRMSRRSIRPLPYHLVYFAQACRIKQILEDKSVSHLHAHFGTNSAEVAMLLRLLGGPPYSFTVHGADEADDGKYLHLDAKVRHAKFVAAVSAYTRAQLFRHISPADWGKVHVVHCGLDGQAFADPHTTDVAEDQVLLCIGRLSAEKGHLILLDAFGRIAARYPEARLVIAGDGPLRPLVETRIADLGLQSRVRITGWISSETVHQEILAARVIVQPSFQEGLPVVLMEAMASCRPVISTYVAGIPELVVPGETGWLVPAGDVDALVEAMNESLRLTKDALRQKGIVAQERVRQRHSISREVEKLMALFAEKS